MKLGRNGQGSRTTANRHLLCLPGRTKSDYDAGPTIEVALAQYYRRWTCRCIPYTIALYLTVHKKSTATSEWAELILGRRGLEEVLIALFYSLKYSHTVPHSQRKI